MNPSERTSHPSLAQVEVLLDYFERNPDLAKGFSKTQNARERSRRQWEELTITLNSMGGTIKTAKQWIKYWSDKKSAIKKKVAARAAARRKTGGGLDEIVELSEVEERIVALFGGEGFGTGDTHLGIQLFPEKDTSELLPSSAEIEIQAIDHSNAYNIQQQQRSSVEATDNVNLVPPHQNRQTARRLFATSEDVFDTPSQSILRDLHHEPSPPPPTLSRTPSPLSMPIASPSRRGATATNSNRRVRASIGSTSSRHAEPPTPQLSATQILTSEASPSRRGATSSNANRSTSARTTRTSRRNAAPSSRSTRPAATPPSQRQTEFSRITERFLRVEEHQLEIQQSNSRVLQTMMEHSVERDMVLAEAVAAMGEGLKALADAINQNNR